MTLVRHHRKLVVHVAEVGVAAGLLTGCAAVPGATSSLPAGSVGFLVTQDTDAEYDFRPDPHDSPLDEAWDCADRDIVQEGFRFGRVSMTTGPRTTAGQNRRLHICLLSVPGVTVLAKALPSASPSPEPAG